MARRTIAATSQPATALDEPLRSPCDWALRVPRSRQRRAAAFALGASASWPRNRRTAADELHSSAPALNSRLLSPDPSVPVASCFGRNPSYHVPNNRRRDRETRCRRHRRNRAIHGTRWPGRRCRVFPETGARRASVARRRAPAVPCGRPQRRRGDDRNQAIVRAAGRGGTRRASSARPCFTSACGRTGAPAAWMLSSTVGAPGGLGRRGAASAADQPRSKGST